jgi:hypothetical protein
LLILTVAFIVSGSIFVDHEYNKLTKFSLQSYVKYLIVYIVFYSFFLIAVFIFGFMIFRNSRCDAFVIGIYALLLFFIGFIPLIIEGSAILGIDNLNMDEY